MNEQRHLSPGSEENPPRKVRRKDGAHFAQDADVGEGSHTQSSHTTVTRPHSVLNSSMNAIGINPNDQVTEHEGLPIRQKDQRLSSRFEEASAKIPAKSDQTPVKKPETERHTLPSSNKRWQHGEVSRLVCRSSHISCFIFPLKQIVENLADCRPRKSVNTPEKITLQLRLHQWGA